MITDASVVGATFARAGNDGKVITICGHDKVDVVVDTTKNYMLIRYTVISRNSPGLVIKTGYFWL